MARRWVSLSALAAAGLALLIAPALAQGAGGAGTDSRAPGYPPIFLTSLNYPGVYGSYLYGPTASTYRVTPTFQARLDNDAPEDVPPRGRAPRAGALGRPALIDVYLPAGATLSFQGVTMRETGSVREFRSPPLEPGRTYTYDVCATWTGDDGREVVRSSRLTVRAGDHVEVDLNRDVLPPPAEQRATLRTLP